METSNQEFLFDDPMEWWLERYLCGVQPPPVRPADGSDIDEEDYWIISD